jgi:hypothetical protein
VICQELWQPIHLGIMLITQLDNPWCWPSLTLDNADGVDVLGLCFPMAEGLAPVTPSLDDQLSTH